MADEISKYGVALGQVYIAADGGRHGYVVVDVSTYADCNDVVVVPFSATAGFEPHRAQRIDAFKLAMVRYALVGSTVPNWFPLGAGLSSVDNQVRVAPALVAAWAPVEAVA